jgi:hypothetical protein
MSGQANWLSRAIGPTVILLIGVYGLWDVVIQPFMAGLKKAPTVCQVIVAEMQVKPGDRPLETASSSTGQEAIVPSGLPVVAATGGKLNVSLEVTNPDDQPVNYTWKALYGRVIAPSTSSKRAIYTAPDRLVDDVISVRVVSPGCLPVEKNRTIAVVPSNSPSPLPTLPASPDPLSTPSPLPTLPAVEPTPEETTPSRFERF